jgi:hypothetical protein
MADCWLCSGVLSALFQYLAVLSVGLPGRGAMNPRSMTLPEGKAAVMPGSSPSYPRRFGWPDDPLSERTHLLHYQLWHCICVALVARVLTRLKIAPSDRQDGEGFQACIRDGRFETVVSLRETLKSDVNSE